MLTGGATGGRRTAIGFASDSTSLRPTPITSHNTVTIFIAAADAVVLPIPQCFFIVQPCALQHGGSGLLAVRPVAHAMLMTQMRSTEIDRRTSRDRNIRRCQLTQRVRECVP